MLHRAQVDWPYAVNQIASGISEAGHEIWQFGDRGSHQRIRARRDFANNCRAMASVFEIPSESAQNWQFESLDVNFDQRNVTDAIRFDVGIRRTTGMSKVVVISAVVLYSDTSVFCPGS